MQNNEEMEEILVYGCITLVLPDLLFVYFYIIDQKEKYLNARSEKLSHLHLLIFEINLSYFNINIGTWSILLFNKKNYDAYD